MYMNTELMNVDFTGLEGLSEVSRVPGGRDFGIRVSSTTFGKLSKISKSERKEMFSSGKNYKLKAVTKLDKSKLEGLKPIRVSASNMEGIRSRSSQIEDDSDIKSTLPAIGETRGSSEDFNVEKSESLVSDLVVNNPSEDELPISFEDRDIAPNAGQIDTNLFSVTVPEANGLNGDEFVGAGYEEQNLIETSVSNEEPLVGKVELDEKPFDFSMTQLPEDFDNFDNFDSVIPRIESIIDGVKVVPVNGTDKTDKREVPIIPNDRDSIVINKTEAYSDDVTKDLTEACQKLQALKDTLGERQAICDATRRAASGYKSLYSELELKASAAMERIKSENKALHDELMEVDSKIEEERAAMKDYAERSKALAAMLKEAGSMSEAANMNNKGGSDKVVQFTKRAEPKMGNRAA